MSASVPVYWQYQSERGISLGRYAPVGNGFIAHQLLFNDLEDINWLLRSRPVTGSAFKREFIAHREKRIPLPLIKAESLTNASVLSDSFNALENTFKNAKQALAMFIAALKRATIDPAFFILARVNDSPDKASETARALTEIMFRCLPEFHARKSGFLSNWRGDRLNDQCRLMFTDKDYSVPDSLSRRLIRLDCRSLTWVFPPNTSFYAGDQDLELAEAMLARDLNWIDRIRQTPPISVSVDSFRLNMPPFERGMSIYQYVCDWIEELERRRSDIDDAIINQNVINWNQIESRIISAGELSITNMQYLRELNAILAMFKDRKTRDWLEVPDGVLADLIVVLIDSIQWVNVDIVKEDDRELIMALWDNARALRGMDIKLPVEFDYKLRACEIIGKLLSGEGEAVSAVDQGIELMLALQPEATAHMRDVRYCLNWYVDNRCYVKERALKPDSIFIGAMILGGIRCSKGSVRLNIDRLEQFVVKHCGDAVWRKCLKKTRAFAGSLATDVALIRKQR
jgi:hypothetical protein